MRRRSRRAPNTSESTGKIGQEIPSNQPAPLVPFYPDDAPARQAPPAPQAPAREGARPARPDRPDRPDRPVRHERPAPQQAWQDAPGAGRYELETQPETPSVPPPE